MTRPLRLWEKKLILIPVNNAYDDGAPSTPNCSGTHWSLLVIDMTKKQYIHIDTLAMNSSAAKSILEGLFSIFDWDPSSGVTSKDFVNIKQVGTSECGLHVMTNAERVIDQFFGSCPTVKESPFSLIQDFRQAQNDEIFDGRKRVSNSIVKEAIKQERFTALAKLLAALNELKSSQKNAVVIRSNCSH